MPFPETPREQIVDAIIQSAAHPYTLVQKAHEKQSEAPRQRISFRDKVRNFHDQRSGDPIYQLGCILGGIGVTAGGVSVVVELATGSELAQGAGALGLGLSLLGVVVVSQS